MVFVVCSEDPVLCSAVPLLCLLLCFPSIHVFVCSLLFPPPVFVLLHVLLFQSLVSACSQGRQGAPVLELSAGLPLLCVGRDPLLPEMLNCHLCRTRLRRRARLTAIMERAFSSCFASCHQWEEIKAYLFGSLWVWEISSVLYELSCVFFDLRTCGWSCCSGWKALLLLKFFQEWEIQFL